MLISPRDRIITVALGLLLLVIPAGANDLPEITNDVLHCLNNATRKNRSQLNLRTECPAFYLALQSKGLLSALEAPLPDQISISQLAFLTALIKDPSAAARRLDTNDLDELLAGILKAHEPDTTHNWWQMFLTWLKGLQTGNHENELNWLVRFLEAISPSEHTLQLILYVVFAIIILLAVGLVVQELYLSGLFSRTGGKQRNSAKQTPAESIPVKHTLSLAEIRNLTPKQQVCALINRVIDSLFDQQFLPVNPALTNQELVKLLIRNDSLPAAPFSELAEDAESVLYGDVIPSAQTLQCCWHNAELILKSLHK